MQPHSILTEAGPARPNLDPAWEEGPLLALHDALLRSRVLDRFLGELQNRGMVSMFVPAKGCEGHIYGALAALNPADWLFADTRMTGAALARGLDLRSYLAMALGSAEAAHLGHAQSMEMTARAQNLVSLSSPLGTQIVQASGTAHAMKLRGDPHCTLAWFGPGAAASGDFHVGLNFAAVFEVPAIFYFCSGARRAQQDMRLSGDLIERAKGYGIEGQRVDGSDVFAVHSAVATAARRARDGGGPTLIEGLSGGESGDADPLIRLEGYLESRGLDGARRRSQAEEPLLVELRMITEQLLRTAPAATASLFEHVLSEPSERLRAQREGLENHLARFEGGGIA